VRPLPATASTDAGDEDGGDATAARTPSGGRGVGPLLRKVSGRLTARVPASSAPRGPAGVHPSVVLGFENCTTQLQPQYRCEWS